MTVASISAVFKNQLRFAIPASPDAITPDWLTQALRATKAINTASVARVTLARIREEEGFSGGGLYLAHLTYDHADPHAACQFGCQTLTC